MSRPVGVTLSAEQTSKLINGEPIEINLPPDAGKLILRAKANTLDTFMDKILGNGRRM